MDLSILNTLAIVIIVFVVAMNFIISAHNYKKIKDNQADIIKMNNDIADYIDYLERAIRDYVKSQLEQKTQNILDLNEFNDLDPKIKQLYKQHIVENLMPSLMGIANNIYNKNSSKFTDANISLQIKEMISQLKQSGFAG